MKRAMTILLTISGLSVAMIATAQDDPIEAETIAAEEQFEREGERCISANAISQTHAPDDQTILFYMRGNDVYRNTLRNECRGLERENRISYRVTANRLCSTDSITVLENFGSSLGRGRSCGLGEFYPISKEDADFRRYGERSEIQEEPEAVDLPDDETSQDSSYGIDEYNNETDYNYEC